MSAALAITGCGRRSQERRRNFPFVKVKGSGETTVPVEKAAFLQVIMTLHIVWPLDTVNIPNILILCVHLSNIPRKTQKRLFPEDFLKIKLYNKSLYLYSPEHTVPE